MQTWSSSLLLSVFEMKPHELISQNVELFLETMFLCSVLTRPSHSFLPQDGSLSSLPARRTSTAWRGWRGGRASPSPCPSPATLRTPSLTPPCPEAPTGDAAAHWLRQALQQRGGAEGRDEEGFTCSYTIAEQLISVIVFNFQILTRCPALTVLQREGTCIHPSLLERCNSYFFTDPPIFYPIFLQQLLFYCTIIIASIRCVPQSVVPLDHRTDSLSRNCLSTETVSKWDYVFSVSRCVFHYKEAVYSSKKRYKSGEIPSESGFHHKIPTHTCPPPMTQEVFSSKKNPLLVQMWLLFLVCFHLLQCCLWGLFEIKHWRNRKSPCLFASFIAFKVFTLFSVLSTKKHDQ